MEDVVLLNMEELVLILCVNKESKHIIDDENIVPFDTKNFVLILHMEEEEEDKLLYSADEIIICVKEE